MKFILILLSILSLSQLKSQPGDFNFRLVVSDYYDFPDCNKSPFKIYACKVPVADDFLIPKAEDYFRNVQITDSLKCIKNNDPLFPYKSFYQGESILQSNLLIIVKNNKDTMFLNGTGENLIVDWNGVQSYLAPVILFKKGIYNLAKLQQEDKEYRILQNMIYRDYYLFSSNFNSTYNPWVKKINEFKLAKLNFNADDTLSIKLSGKIISDGSCSNSGILWILQKKNGEQWINSYEFLKQMDCGLGIVDFEDQQINLASLSAKQNPNSSKIPGLKIDSGTYRIVIFDENWLPYFSDHFYFQ